MLVKTRKNKNYTSILLQSVSEEAFKESKKVYDSLQGLKVVKPSKKAWQDFIKFHSLTLDKVEKGETYKVLGTSYTVVRNLDYNRKGSNKWNAILKYYDRKYDRYEEVGIIATDNFAAAVHEISYKNMTGNLMYF